MTDLAHRVAWYEAGMDGSERTPGVRPGAGQLWYRLLSLPVAERLDLLTRFLEDADVAYRCLVMDHEATIDHDRRRLLDAHTRLDAIINAPSGPRPVLPES
jgi:hypothetical protein